MGRKPIVLALFRLYETRGKNLWYVEKVKGDGGKDWSLLLGSQVHGRSPRVRN